jgi:hypothetical protein
MRLPITVVLIVIHVIVAGSIITNVGRFAAAADPLPASIGHLRPHADGLSNARAEQAVQDRLSAFDPDQRRLDKNLTICRC